MFGLQWLAAFPSNPSFRGIDGKKYKNAGEIRKKVVCIERYIFVCVNYTLGFKTITLLVQTSFCSPHDLRHRRLFSMPNLSLLSLTCTICPRIK